MAAIRVRAIRFEQNGRVFYTTVMPVGEVLERSKVDVWNDEDPPDARGYQRDLNRGRVREVANYVEREDAILPTGGLLNARSRDGSAYGEVLSFEPDPGQEGIIHSGTLTIDVSPLWVVDMQHRLGGLRMAIEEDGREDLTEFPVVATIADGLSKLEEVTQFDVINTTQKKVSTALARQTIAMRMSDPDQRLEFDRRGRLWEGRGAIVARWLNDRGTVWKGRILPPNKSKREMPRAIVRETSFVTSLKPILQSPLFMRIPEDQVGELVDRYWQAVARVFPKAFETPEHFVIQKTPGIFSLHAVAPEVVEAVRSKGVTVDNIVEVIESWGELGDEYWDKDGESAARFGSMKGFSILAAELRHKLPKLEVGLVV